MTMPGTQSISEWVVAIATVGALLIAIWQIRENGKLARQDTAIQTWMEYVRLGLANPDLGETRIALKYLRIRSAEKLVSGDTIGSQRYLWFLTVMLDACQNLILHRFTKLWNTTIEENIRYHREALAILWPDESKHYSKTFGVLVARVLNEPGT